MNIQTRLQKLEKTANVSGFCQCYEISIQDYPKRISSDWLKKDFCLECRKPINKKRVEQIFNYHEQADRRLKETEEIYRRRGYEY
ncbi:MAG TPA: hypothetical protein VK892_06365 [Pyrinomonadaceae bacterium]|nr:hypothetical protein [Pyrinomonadaceae bacterium]